MTKTADGGLRERRRRETQRQIHAVALRLARERGFGKVTNEMISAAAGVSLRTFFNYFPSKEAAVLHGPDELPPELVAGYLSAGPASPGEVLADLARLLVADLAADPPGRLELHDMLELAREHPQLHAGLLARFDGFRRSLAAAVAQRLGQDADDEAPRLLAALALATVQTALERWSAAGEAHGQGSPVPYLEDSVALLATLMSPAP